MVQYTRAVGCRLSPRREGVTHMEFFDWLDHVATWGTFVLALLTYLKK